VHNRLWEEGRSREFGYLWQGSYLSPGRASYHFLGLQSHFFFSNLGIITWAFNGSCLGFQSKIILEAFQTDTGRLNGIRIELGL